MTPGLTIEDRLRRGESLTDLLAAGIDRGAIPAVLAEHGWELNEYGRIPFAHRITTPPGLRNLPPGSLIVRPEAEREPPPPPRKRTPKPKPAAPIAPKPARVRGVREHGTRKGYSQHYRLRDTPPCDACRDEWNRTTQVRRQQRRSA